MAKDKLIRMDNVGIVVESLDETIAFFAELGLKLEGRATIEGEWAGRVTGLGNQTCRDCNDGSRQMATAGSRYHDF